VKAAAPTATPASERAHAEVHEHRGPDEQADVDRAEDDLGGAVIGAAATERVGAEHRQPDRPDEEEREHPGRRREAGHMAGLAVGGRAVGGTPSEIDGAAEDPEVLDPDEQAGDHRLDDEQQPVELDVVEQPSRRPRGEKDRDSGKEDHGGDRLLPAGGRLRRVVPHPYEHRGRRGQDAKQTKPPLPFGLPRPGLRLSAHAASL